MLKKVIASYLNRTKGNAIIKAMSEDKVSPFDGEFNETLRNTYILGLPAYIRVYYIDDDINISNNLDKSEYMFLCFDDALLVRGRLKSLTKKYGEGKDIHMWVERNGYVYDPITLQRFDKEAYYSIFEPYDITKVKMDEYREDKKRDELYQEVRSATIDYYKKDGEFRLDLLDTMPLVEHLAADSTNISFKEDVRRFREEVGYDFDTVFNELQQIVEIAGRDYHLHL